MIASTRRQSLLHIPGVRVVSPLLKKWRVRHLRTRVRQTHLLTDFAFLLLTSVVRRVALLLTISRNIDGVKRQALPQPRPTSPRGAAAAEVGL